jgi:hypothetical protein
LMEELLRVGDELGLIVGHLRFLRAFRVVPPGLPRRTTLPNWAESRRTARLNGLRHARASRRERIPQR